MNKSDKIIVIFYVSLAVSVSSALIYLDYSYDRPNIPELIPKPLEEIEIVKTVNVTKKEIFDVMADLQRYPLILPQNIISVTIINQTDSVIYAQEEVIEKGIKTKLLAKHTLFRYDNHTLEIMNGDAQGTIITQTFEETNSSTTLTTNVKLHLKGKLEFLGYFSTPSVKQRLDQIIDNFVAYTRGFDSESKKIIDDLYREILHRPADPDGLRYYGSLLESGKMSVEDIRLALLRLG